MNWRTTTLVVITACFLFYLLYTYAYYQMEIEQKGEIVVGNEREEIISFIESFYVQLIQKNEIELFFYNSEVSLRIISNNLQDKSEKNAWTVDSFKTNYDAFLTKANSTVIEYGIIDIRYFQAAYDVQINDFFQVELFSVYDTISAYETFLLKSTPDGWKILQYTILSIDKNAITTPTHN